MTLSIYCPDLVSRHALESFPNLCSTSKIFFPEKHLDPAIGVLRVEQSARSFFKGIISFHEIIGSYLYLERVVQGKTCQFFAVYKNSPESICESIWYSEKFNLQTCYPDGIANFRMCQRDLQGKEYDDIVEVLKEFIVYCLEVTQCVTE